MEKMVEVLARGECGGAARSSCLVVEGCVATSCGGSVCLLWWSFAAPSASHRGESWKSRSLPSSGFDDCIREGDAAALDTKNAGGLPRRLIVPSCEATEGFISQSVDFAQGAGSSAAFAAEASPLVKSMLAELLEEVLVEVAPGAVEDLLRAGLLAVLVFKIGELNATCVIGDLLETVITRSALAIDNDLLSEGIFEPRVEGAGDVSLPIVVVNLDSIEGLEELKPVEQEVDQIALHSVEEFVTGGELLLLIGEGSVLKRGLVRKGAEAEEEALSCLRGKSRVVVSCTHERIEVKGNILKPSYAKGVFVYRNKRGKILVLVMENKGHQVIPGTYVTVTRLINENGKLPHWSPSLDTKNAGGIPRPLFAPSCEATNDLIPHPDCSIQYESKRKAT